MTSDPFLDGVSPLALRNIADRTPLPRTVEAVVRRLDMWHRPQAWLELTQATHEDFPEVMIRWWRYAAQIMTRQEEKDQISKILSGEIETFEPTGEFAVRMDRAAREYEALTDEQKVQRSVEAWRDKAARIKKRNASSLVYQAFLQKMLDDEKAYVGALADDLDKNPHVTGGA